MTADQVLQAVREALRTEAAVYEKGGWPADGRQVLYARAEGAAWALRLADLLAEDAARAFLVDCHASFGLSG